MSERVIEQANLNVIENNLATINNNLQVVNSNIDIVNTRVEVVYDEIGSLLNEFRAYVDAQKAIDRVQLAETRLVKIRTILNHEYGHYDKVRRMTTGILQANDLGIVKKETITAATEKLMLDAPGYWLAPCLVALAAWIDNQPELAEKALREGIKRSDEKTSLFFALVCRRAERKDASLKWIQRYLSKQNEKELDRKTIIILDAYAGGLLGRDSEKIVMNQIRKWMEYFEEEPGFIDRQREQWSDALEIKRKPISDSEYTYLRQYSSTWVIIEELLEYAYLHAEMLAYFNGIFLQDISTETLKEQLDEILNSLVTDFDEEERKPREEERFEQLIIEYEGNESRALQKMDIEKTAFDEKKDFMQFLTDAAMKPESSHSSAAAQMLSFALSKDRVLEAYRDMLGRCHAKEPMAIEINVGDFHAWTSDGKNEESLISQYHAFMEKEKKDELDQKDLSSHQKFFLPGGGVIASVGIGMLIAGSVFLGIIAIIAGIAMILYYYSEKKKSGTTKNRIEKQYEQNLLNGEWILRATLAEVVDFREDYERKDAESVKVLDFLEHMRSDEYVRTIAGENRRIRT